jgi:hypothetical protein|tara:strand:- start:493 stop:843 length:351 start_codon:yes stop_codon:yes gene_type:complete
MTRGVKKGAFAIDAQRGEGSAAREAALRGAPLLPEDEVQVNMERPADAPQTNIQAQAPQLGNVFAPSNDATPMMQQNPVFDEFEIVDPGQTSNTNMILAAINDLLGGSEEASSMIT